MWYYSHTHKPELSQKTSKKYVTFLESNQEKMLQYPQIYFSAVTNFVTRCCSIDLYKEALVGIEKLEKIPALKGAAISDGLKTEIKFFSVERRLLIYTMQRNFEKAFEFFEETYAFIGKNKNNLHVGFLSLYRIFVGISCFHLKKYDIALTQLRQMFDEKNDIQRFDNYLYAHILQIMTHVEMKNYRIIPYQIQAAKRFCTAKKFKQKSISLFFELISKLIKTENQLEFNQTKLNYLEKFNVLLTNEGEEIMYSTLALDLWLKDSK